MHCGCSNAFGNICGVRPISHKTRQARPERVAISKCGPPTNVLCLLPTKLPDGSANSASEFLFLQTISMAPIPVYSICLPPKDAYFKIVQKGEDTANAPWIKVLHQASPEL